MLFVDGKDTQNFFITVGNKCSCWLCEADKIIHTVKTVYLEIASHHMC